MKEMAGLTQAIIQDKGLPRWLLDVGGGSRHGRSEEMWLYRAALECDVVEVSSYACLVFEKSTDLVNSADAGTLAKRLMVLIARKHEDTREFAARALEEITSRFLKGEEVEGVARLARVMLTDADCETRRRGANIIGGIENTLKGQEAKLAAVALIAASEQLPKGDREVSAHQMIVRALSWIAQRVPDAGTAESTAKRLLSELDCKHCRVDYGHFGQGTILIGLAEAIPTLGDSETRDRVHRKILGSAQDESLFYCYTSRPPTLNLHSGAEALGIAARTLSGELLTKAIAACEQMIAKHKEDRFSFDEALKVLRERKAALEKK